MKSLEECTVTIMSSDLDQSISFYEDHVGLQLIANYGGHYAELKAPGLVIGLHPSNNTHQFQSSISVGFGVTAFDKEMEALLQKGIKVNLTQDGPLRLGHFQDPDGNPLYLAEIESNADADRGSMVP